MFVGIDVSEDQLEVHLRSAAESLALARDGAGLEQLGDLIRVLFD
jgi:hypothetical protein